MNADAVAKAIVKIAGLFAKKAPVAATPVLKTAGESYEAKKKAEAVAALYAKAAAFGIKPKVQQKESFEAGDELIL